jgi:hypothetical protein
MLTKAFQKHLKGDDQVKSNFMSKQFKKGATNKKQTVAIMSENKEVDKSKKEYKEKLDTGPSKKLRKKLGMK